MECTQDSVATHASPSKRVWVTHEGKVFDITHYLPHHPGGDVIVDAAGQDIAPFWETYYHSDDARQLLATMQVGSGDGAARDRRQEEGTADVKRFA